MRIYLKFAGALLGACGMLLAFAFTASAGEYYDAGYYSRDYTPRHSHVWYSTNCCYRKVVRHSRSVRYVHVDRYRRYYHSSRYYDGDRYYSTRHYGTRYYSRPYGDYDYGRSYRRARYTSYYDYGRGGCYTVRVRVEDGRGGWVWGRRRVCN